MQRAASAWPLRRPQSSAHTAARFYASSQLWAGPDGDSEAGDSSSVRTAKRARPGSTSTADIGAQGAPAQTAGGEDDLVALAELQQRKKKQSTPHGV